MKFRRFLSVIACLLAVEPIQADMMFAEFFDFDPVTHLDFGYAANAPVIRVTYLRSRPGEFHTEINLEISEGTFDIVGHTCPPRMSNGKSCMIFISFDPGKAAKVDNKTAPIYSATLSAMSKEGESKLVLSAHSDRQHCETAGLPLSSYCGTP